MTIIKPFKRTDIIALRYAKRRLRIFSRRYAPPPGYLLIKIDAYGDITSSTHSIKINSYDTLYLLKINFEIYWGVVKLPCIISESKLPDKFGIHGTADFIITIPEKFFASLDVGKTNKIYVNCFKSKWTQYWDSMIRIKLSEKDITKKQAPKAIQNMEDEINKETIDKFGVSVSKINIKGTN